MLRTTEDQLLCWLAASGPVVLIMLIRSVMRYLRVWRRLRTVEFLAVKVAASPTVAVEYTDGDCTIRAEPRSPGSGGAQVAIFPANPGGRLGRRWSDRLDSDAS